MSNITRGRLIHRNLKKWVFFSLKNRFVLYTGKYGTYSTLLGALDSREPVLPCCTLNKEPTQIDILSALYQT